MKWSVWIVSYSNLRERIDFFIFITLSYGNRKKKMNSASENLWVIEISALGKICVDIAKFASL